MHRLALIAALTLAATSPLADTAKATSCAYQAQVVDAIRQARLDGVREREVQPAILATNPDWPENYNAAIPLLTPWVYEMKRRDVKKQDLAAAWTELCLQP